MNKWLRYIIKQVSNYTCMHNIPIDRDIEETYVQDFVEPNRQKSLLLNLDRIEAFDKTQSKKGGIPLKANWKRTIARDIKPGEEFIHNGTVCFRLKEEDEISHPTREWALSSRRKEPFVLATMVDPHDGRFRPTVYAASAIVEQRPIEERSEYPKIGG